MGTTKSAMTGCTKGGHVIPSPFQKEKMAFVLAGKPEKEKHPQTRCDSAL